MHPHLGHFLRPWRHLLLLVALSAANMVCVASASAQDKAIDFNRDVRGVLSDNCFKCHGFDPKTREANLRLDMREGATAKLENGKTAIVPGDLKASELVRRITSDDPKVKMPPPSSNKSLKPKQIETLKQWVAEGAEYKEHWAFIAPQRPPLPKVAGKDWPLNAIDHFVLAKLESMGLEPSAEADRATLIRRVSFDLTGLPPTPDEIDAFVNDKSADAYEKVVDRLLASPRYGEHMTRQWLDLARYADTNGYQYDLARTQYRWRDWVIDAYNSNMPFDQFTIEQLAGDLLPDAEPSQILATGFNRNHPITIEGGVIDEEYRTEYVMDRVNTTATTWLSLTVGCARCHDHKFDPISQKEFYQLYAFFNRVPEKGHNGFAPQMKFSTEEQLAAMDEIDAGIAAAKKELDAAMASLDDDQSAWEKHVSDVKPTQWHALKDQTATATGGTTLTRQEDGSFLAGGAAPAKTMYTFSAKVDTPVAAIRLEAMLDESLPGRGPGRASNSNFVLNEIEAELISTADSSITQKIRFMRATADFSQDRYHVSAAIDGKKSGQNGWAVHGGSPKNAKRTAVFVADKPYSLEGGGQLRVRLVHDSGYVGHGIGRPRLSIAAATPNDIPENIAAIVAVPTGKRDDVQKKQLRDYFIANHLPVPANEIRQQIAALEAKKKAINDSVPNTLVMQDRPGNVATFVLDRGLYDQPRKDEPVQPGVPAVFPRMPDGAPSNRLGFAQWLMRPDHPLTARVAVNRYWQRLFGEGLVKTTEDFGVQSPWPSNMQLIDWLATEFVRLEWDIKAMHKTMVMSAAYRQSSNVTPELIAADPGNRYVARGARMRLSAEEIRDNALFVSGLLVEKTGGPSVYPYHPDGLYEELNNRPGLMDTYRFGKGDDLYRRSMYTYWKRTLPPPTMSVLDAPEREYCVVSRSRTNTPLQALALLHDPQFIEAARAMAERMIKEGGDDAATRLSYGFRLATGRKPGKAELNELETALEAQRDAFAADPSMADTLLAVGESKRDESIDKIEHAAYANAARIILNLDETITKE